ncbi:sce7725 family protein [Tenacibaculum aquimarinum]|uniref:sce7725 family protein n=1 Tax=Tenacibaculum aquimarinum TaxID=2910675 RepID=UPI001F0AB27F|nr:sce7725 family protein [Tenacibaculum aquimarinum]MCH3882383.1 sce7725 family protein [Tenacibaculum aquimarinum]
MYFPYVRGKQFELIALRDLCSIFSDDILKTSPVIEPVKSTSTFKSTLKELASKNVNFNIIINPRVGDLKGKHQEIIDVVSESLQGYENFQLAVIMDDKSERNIQTFIDFIGALNFNFNGVTLIHNSEVSGNNIELLTTNLNIVYNLIYFSKTSRRYYREFDQNTRVSLDDYFKEMPKNADYLDLESSFSEEYKYYQEDGFVGFGDFLTIGDNYSDSGFLPRAVAIHLSYIDGNDRIRVKHFVSDSNGDVSDIGGKFSEAIHKLVTWCNQQDIQTNAVNTFRDLHQRGHFPGLGTLKKLSIMNHIELVIKNI